MSETHNTDRRQPHLDGVRGVAILFVLAWHYLGCQVASDAPWILRAAKLASNPMWSGVDLFFVLSGFLICGILLDHKKAPNYFQVFYWRRICRIFPLYFLLVGSFLGGSILFGTDERFSDLFTGRVPIWTYCVFIQNYWMSMLDEYGCRWLAVTWSLAVEEQFYMIIPLIVWWSSRRFLLALFCAGIIAAPLLRLWLPGFHAMATLPWRGEGLCFGGLLAMLMRNQSFVHRAKSLPRTTWLGGLIAFMMIVGVLEIFNLQPGWQMVWTRTLGYAVLVLLATVQPAGIRLSFLTHPWLVWFGLRSYSIYLLHELIVGLTHGYFRGEAPEIHQWSDFGITFAALIVTLVISALSYSLIEAPMMKIGHKLRYAE